MFLYVKKFSELLSSAILHSASSLILWWNQFPGSARCLKIVQLQGVPFPSWPCMDAKVFLFSKDRCFYSLVFLPIFVGKHLLSEGPYAMVDFKVDPSIFLTPINFYTFQVTYENHREYCKAEKTPVRIFTDLPVSEIELQSATGYKFCRCCNRWVAKENRHCKKCGSCTTKVMALSAAKCYCFCFSLGRPTSIATSANDV